MSFALSELKRSKAYLLGVLGVEKDSHHVKCPFHEDRHGSLSIYQSEDGVWRWKCHGCGVGGTVIDAAILAYGAKGAKDAVRAIERTLGVTILRDEAPAVPVLNNSAEAIVAKAHADLLNSFDALALLAEKRNITDLDVIKQFRLGYVDDYEVYAGYSWYTGWILPVTDAGGRLTAVKVHGESRRGKTLSDLRKIPKCTWLPLGTTNKPGGSKKLHGYSTLWPGPEGCRGQPLLLTGGELKAVRLICAGHHATSPTAGENRMPEHLIYRIKKAEPSEVLVIFDADRAGEAWRDRMLASLADIGILCHAVDLSSDAPLPVDDIEADWEAAQAARAPQTEPEIIAEIERLESLLRTAPEHQQATIEATCVALVEKLGRCDCREIDP